MRRFVVLRDDAEQVQDGAALNRRHPRRQDSRLQPEIRRQNYYDVDSGKWKVFPIDI